MSVSRQIWLAHLVSGLDMVLFSLLVQAFSYDGSVLALVLRGIAQIQFGSPAQIHPTRSLAFFGNACLATNAVALVFHAVTYTGQRPRHSLLIDFIGQDYIPRKAAILGLDVIICVVQLFFITVSYENAHHWMSVVRGEQTEPAAAQTDTPAEEDETETSPLALTAVPTQDPDAAPIAEWPVRPTLRRLFGPFGDKPDTARRRTPGEERLDAASDEERNVGVV